MDFIKSLFADGRWMEMLNTSYGIGYVIALCLFIATLLFFHRFFYLNRCDIDCDNFLDGILNSLSGEADLRELIREAVVICNGYHYSPVAKTAKAVLSRYSEDVAELRQAADEAAAREIPRLQRNARLIAMMGQLAPMLGLLGTMIGLLEMFSQEQFGGGKVVETLAVVTGMRAALVTSVLGILVAIFVLFYNAILDQRARAIIQEMEDVSNALISRLCEQGRTAAKLNSDIQRKEDAVVD